MYVKISLKENVCMKMCFFFLLLFAMYVQRIFLKK